MIDSTLRPISTQKELEDFCSKLSRNDFICLDTEFQREKTFWPKLCLIQAASTNVEGIIDPIAKNINLTPLFRILNDTSVVKVFHAARQDMEIFNRLTKQLPKPIFDTQIAAMALGLGDSLGYNKLIKKVLDVAIDKSSQFTDWTTRPLKPKQLKYALGDVTYLREAYVRISKELHEKQRTHWVSEEMAVLENPSTYDSSPEIAWRRMRLKKSGIEYLAILVAVCEWRERRAQNLDKPRQHVLRDNVIYDIAEQKLSTMNDLLSLRSIPQRLPRNQIENVAKVVASAIENPNRYVKDVPNEQAAFSNSQESTSELLKVLLKHVSEEYSVVPRLIADGSTIEQVARGHQNKNLPVFSGWRDEVFGQKARDLLSGRIALSLQNGKVKLHYA